MKNMRIYYFAALLLSVSLLISCSKGSTVDDPIKDNPDTPDKIATLPTIKFGKPGTKVLMNNDSLLLNGNKIKVYDLLTDFDGTISDWNSSSPYYIKDEIVYNGSTVWNYASQGIYPWTVTGIHHFFGYLKYYAKKGLKVTDLVATEPSPSGTTMEVPFITFNTGTKQFDFIYSDLVERDAEDKNYNVIPLNFKHLFTALSVQVENKTDLKVELESIKFEDENGKSLNNKKRATINFASSSTADLKDASSDGAFFPLMSSSEILSKNQSYDPLANKRGTTTSLEKSFFMLWPQTVEEIAPTNELDENDPKRAEGYTHDSNDSLIVLKYKLQVNPETDEWVERETRLKFPTFPWSPGKKVSITIQFADKLIDLLVKVLEWDYNEFDVDFSEGTIVVTEGLSFTPGTCSISGKTAVVTNTNPRGSFRIVAPVGGTWKVGLVGDTDYFDITPREGIIDPNNPEVVIRVIPDFTKPRPADKHVNLRFTVDASGREMDANTEINRDDWTILFPKE